MPRRGCKCGSRSHHRRTDRTACRSRRYDPRSGADCHSRCVGCPVARRRSSRRRNPSSCGRSHNGRPLASWARRRSGTARRRRGTLPRSSTSLLLLPHSPRRDQASAKHRPSHASSPLFSTCEQTSRTAAKCQQRPLRCNSSAASVVHYPDGPVARLVSRRHFRRLRTDVEEQVLRQDTEIEP
jgi:hypothetical protein